MKPMNNIKLITKFSYTVKDHFAQASSLSKFYQEVLLAYAKSQVVSKPQNKDEILKQCLWGNRFIYNEKKGKHECLFFVSFINSNIINIGDLNFINGHLDEKYIYRIITDKRQIFGQITKLKKALKTFSIIIGDHSPDDIQTCRSADCDIMHIATMSKSKLFYKQLVLN